jgi:Variant SH3 domain/RhoGAP domain
LPAASSGSNAAGSVAVHLYLKYFKPDSPFAINLAQRDREQVELAMKGGRVVEDNSIAASDDRSNGGDNSPAESRRSRGTTVAGIDASAFDSAQRAVFSLMALDTYPSFVQSQEQEQRRARADSQSGSPGPTSPRERIQHATSEKQLLRELDEGEAGGVGSSFLRLAHGQARESVTAPSSAGRNTELKRSASTRFSRFAFKRLQRDRAKAPDDDGLEALQRQMKHESDAIAAEHVRDIEGTPLAIHVCAQLQERVTWKMIECSPRQTIADFTLEAIQRIHQLKGKNPADFGFVMASSSGRALDKSGAELPAGLDLTAALEHGDAAFLDPDYYVSAVKLDPDRHALILRPRQQLQEEQQESESSGLDNRVRVSVRLKKKSHSLLIRPTTDTPTSVLDYVAIRDKIKRAGLYLAIQNRDLDDDRTFSQSTAFATALSAAAKNPIVFLALRRTKSAQKKHDRQQEGTMRTRIRRATLKMSGDGPGAPPPSAIPTAERESHGRTDTPPTLRARSSTNASRRYFGQPIRDLLMQEGQTTAIPWLVEDCIAFLLLHVNELSSEGGAPLLFASPSTLVADDSPVSIAVADLTAKIDQGNRLDLLGGDLSDPSVAAALLRGFLEGLPEPLLTFDLWPRLAEVAATILGNADGESAASELRGVLSELPTENASLVSALVEFFHSCSERGILTAPEFALLFAEQFMAPANRPPATETTGSEAQNRALGEAILRELVLDPALVCVRQSGAGVESFLHTVVALWDYDAANAEEISMQAGDLIGVIAEDDTGWWKGQLLNSQAVGLFPVSYVELADESDQLQVDTSTSFEEQYELPASSETLLRQLFPEVRLEKIEELLAGSNGDAESVIEQLLDDGTRPTPSPKSSISRKSAALRKPPDLVPSHQQQSGATGIVIPVNRNAAEALKNLGSEYQNVPEGIGYSPETKGGPSTRPWLIKTGHEEIPDLSGIKLAKKAPRKAKTNKSDPEPTASSAKSAGDHRTDPENGDGHPQELPANGSSDDAIPPEEEARSDSILEVLDVAPGGPFEKGGVRPGDQIVLFGSLSRAQLARETGVLENSAAIQQRVLALASRCQGSMLSVLVKRDGNNEERIKLQVTPARSPDDSWAGLLGCQFATNRDSKSGPPAKPPPPVPVSSDDETDDEGDDQEENSEREGQTEEFAERAARLAALVEAAARAREAAADLVRAHAEWPQDDTTTAENPSQLQGLAAAVAAARTLINEYDAYAERN